MSWQEELRRLDEELAAGRISADDYRLRRDNVLSSAVNIGPPGNQGAPGQSDSTQIIAPVAPPHQQPPATPGASADATQIVSPAFDAERTQAVPQSSVPQGWAPGNDEAERTQVVPGVPPQAVAGGYRPQGHGSGGFPAQQGPYQQQQPWNVSNQNTSTPWGSSEFPADTSWVGQGPEPSFETTPSKGGGKKVLAFVAAVLVLTGLGVGGYFLFTGDSDQPTPPVAQSSSAAPTTPPKPKDDLEIAKLPGTIKETSDFPTFADLAARKVMTEDENAALTTSGGGKSRLSVAVLPSGAQAVVLTVRASSAAAADKAVADLDKLQAVYKLADYQGTAPAGVDVKQLPGQSLIRGHYAHQSTVVRIQVNGTDPATAAKVFDEILAAQLAELPADG